MVTINSTYFIELLKWLCEILYVKCSEQCLESRKYSMNSSYYYLTPWITDELTNAVDSVSAMLLLCSWPYFPFLLFHPTVIQHCSSTDSYISLLICFLSVYFKHIWFSEDTLGDRIYNINLFFHTLRHSKFPELVQQHNLGLGSVCCFVGFAFLLPPWSQYCCYSSKYHLHSRWHGEKGYFFSVFSITKVGNSSRKPLKSPLEHIYL